MQNLRRKYLQVLKIWNVDAIIYNGQAEKYLQVQRKASCRYGGLQKSICKSEYQGLADTMVAKKSICNGEYQGLADTSVATKTSTTLNKRDV